eukprot:CAMPEP_0204652016 /NCGR_PEP_ID=MMETSP0718-20130828/14308_1 /ASSEMBLY_ACC=CAM_ASM_000674 /TAXON_ID=230516 /ORGANISM="Chaetoceros curvisetus" /LENGTH=444 /DNA_ID=CAMNT_0051675921 /DNA_START=257 /DNA_END=1593 /DNA_ORIENTATION=+
MDPSDITPHEHDVLSGRGNGSNLHPGNIRFRQLVNVARERFVSGSLEDKKKYAYCIVHHISSLNPPGRFLLHTSKEYNPQSNKLFKSNNNTVQQMNPSDITPHEHDVLYYGRGNGSHTGTIRFRQLVNVARERYVSGSKEDKKKYVYCIVHHISSLNPPGRFLKQLDGKDGPWSIMSEKYAHDKTRQALREKAPAIEKALREKASDPFLMVLDEQQVDPLLYLSMVMTDPPLEHQFTAPAIEKALREKASDPFLMVLDEQQVDPLLYLSMVMTDPPSSINSLIEVNRRKSVQDALPLIQAVNTSTTTSSLERLHSHPNDATNFTSYCVHCGKNITTYDDEDGDDSNAKNITLRNGTRSFHFDMQGRENFVHDQLLRTDNSHDGHCIIDTMQEQYDEEMNWTKLDGKDGPWSIMSEKDARYKTRLALRSGLPFQLLRTDNSHDGH